MENVFPTVLFVASECGGIARAGGLGDVVRDLSRFLSRNGVRTAVAIPAYEKSRLLGDRCATLRTQFGWKTWKTDILCLDFEGVPVYQFHNKTFFTKEYGSVYVDSSTGGGPFEDDARRFAFFSAAVAGALEGFDPFKEITLIHAHDWHAGVLLTLLKMDSRYKRIASRVRSLFTIHNLAYQGVRPFVYGKEKDLHSFASWFPELYRELVATPRLFDVRDPRSSDACYNPIKAGIRLADLVTTVSPTYAHEITLPDDYGNRFIGGSGLERDLALLARRGRLSGIRNGIDYTTHDPALLDPPFGTDIKGWNKQKQKFKATIIEKLAGLPGGAKIAENMTAWKKRPLAVFISRAVDQKAGILFEQGKKGKTILANMLEKELSLIALASGNLENEFERTMTGDNALFINSFDPDMARDLYAAGDFLMLPSYFEPCGISQMIAMRYGCLPLVHEIGGLHDTVHNNKTGFSYGGTSLDAQKQGLVRALDRVLDIRNNHPEKWNGMLENAMRERFTWDEPVRIYRQLYAQLLGYPVGR